MDLINAIHAGDVEEAKRCVAREPSLVDKADNQGNTPLHYAVAEHHPELIKWLIEQGACTAVENRWGETAAQWFQLFFTSSYSFKLVSAKHMSEEIKHNSEKLIKQYLLGGVPPALRFSQAKTLLHWAIEYRRIKIVKLLLEEISYEEVKQLLHLEDNQGMTPLALAQENYRLDSKKKATQEIWEYIKQKQSTIRPMLQTQWVPPPSFEPIDVEQDKFQELERIFTHRFRQGDIKELERLRPTIVKLAYTVCYQVYLYYTDRIPVFHPRGSGKPAFPIEELLKGLFGTWMDRDQRIFNRVFFSVLNYLQGLLISEQADQVIRFLDKNHSTSGWASPGTDEILINVRAKINTMAMVATLIHEATHRADRTYDFFRAQYSLNGQDLSIDLEHAYQLAATGASELLTPEKKRLFEVRQLFERGPVPGWEKELYHWMALHSAETLTIAILALATLPTGFAQYESRPKPALVIKPRFLQTLCGVATHPKPLAPERPLDSDKRCKINSSVLPDQETRPGTANSDSGISSVGSGTVMEWSSASEPASPPPPLAQSMAAMQPDLLVMSPEALPLPQARHSSSLVDQPLSKNCHLS